MDRVACFDSLDTTPIEILVPAMMQDDDEVIEFDWLHYPAYRKKLEEREARKRMQEAKQ